MVGLAARREGEADWPVGRTRAAVIFTLTFLLLLSDYVCRQALIPMFPALKAEWALSDGRLGALVSVVALAVGLLTAPLSFAADRFGRVRAIVVMALVWSAATLACGLAASYGQLLLARLCLGVGEAAYGSVGGAILFSVFPARVRGAVAAAFLAGGAVGSVLGLAAGGWMAETIGWRGAFVALGGLGLVLASLFAAVVRLPAAPLETQDSADASEGGLASLWTLLTTRTLLLAYAGGGLQFFTLAALIAWTPSLLTRTYGLEPARAGGVAALLVLLSAVGMMVCGAVADGLSRRRPARRALVAAGYCVVTGGLVALALGAPAGAAQLGLMACAFALAGGAAGPASAVGADVSRPAVHATALALATLAFNLLGHAPGPWITGLLADGHGLATALRGSALASLLASVALLAAYRAFDEDAARLRRAGA